jgi:gamma-glutamylcyclotransferase (GGCT)/AIG2-like uncharacterized protein YtfP
MQAEHRLAVYGSLAPGRKNHWVLASMRGAWFNATVRGHLHQEGWGAAEGFPAIVLDDMGPEVPVQVFESEQFPNEWKRIDEFEGPGYRRVEVHVKTAKGEFVACNIYELNRGELDRGPRND